MRFEECVFVQENKQTNKKTNFTSKQNDSLTQNKKEENVVNKYTQTK